MEVSPGLSSILEEPQSEQPQDLWGDPFHAGSVAMSAFLRDRTVEAAMKKGFRLSTFRIRARNGTEYEYAVENVNELLIPHKVEEVLRRKALQDAVVAVEHRGLRRVTSSPVQPEYDLSLNVYGECEEGEGRGGGRTFLEGSC